MKRVTVSSIRPSMLSGTSTNQLSSSFVAGSMAALSLKIGDLGTPALVAATPPFFLSSLVAWGAFGALGVLSGLRLKPQQMSSVSVKRPLSNVMPLIFCAWLMAVPMAIDRRIKSVFFIVVVYVLFANLQIFCQREGIIIALNLRFEV